MRNQYKLTEKRTYALRLVALGATAKEMAPLMGVTEYTVKSYKRQMYLAMNFRNSADVARYAIRNGIIRADENWTGPREERAHE